MGQREDLEELRATLFVALESADVSVKAQVAGQLRAVIKDLAALGVGEVEVSAADELVARREARQGGAGGKSSAARRSQPRRGSGHNRTG